MPMRRIESSSRHRAPMHAAPAGVGGGDGAIIAQRHQCKEGIERIVAQRGAACEQRRGGRVKQREVGELPGMMPPISSSSESAGAAECGR